MVTYRKGELMPKDTFFNLPDVKSNLIILAAVEEFSRASFTAASINQICRRANIPKGSFYQYFRDKLDLYVYIMKLAIEEKIRLFSSVIDDFSTLTLPEQVRLLFLKGVEFANRHPDYAALGEQFSKESDESAKAAVIKEGGRLSESLFLQMIDNAKSKGEIDNRVDSLALSLLLKSLNSAVNEYMLEKFGGAGYEENREEIDGFVDSLLNIVFNGIRSGKD